MSRREHWRPTLDEELKRWSLLSTADLLSRLTQEKTYEVTVEGKTYQVEVKLLERTPARGGKRG